MNQEQAIELAHQIKRQSGRDALAWPLGRQATTCATDHQTWVVWLTNHIYVWSHADWVMNRDSILQIKNKVPAL